MSSINLWGNLDDIFYLEWSSYQVDIRICKPTEKNLIKFRFTKRLFFFGPIFILIHFVFLFNGFEYIGVVKGLSQCFIKKFEGSLTRFTDEVLNRLLNFIYSTFF